MTEGDGVSPLTIRLFGPFEAWVNGAPLPRLRSRKVQWLLALLTLRHEAAVERAWLACLLWPDAPESQALVSLRGSLKDLRRALGPEAARLRSPSLHTLSFDLSGAQVDLMAFDQATARGDVALLEQAISLYRGPLLEGCVEEWAFQEQQAREQAYLGALETLAASKTERGDSASAERYLRLAVTVDPLRESAQRTLMQALAVGGNYTAATQVYQDLRRLLHRELNAAPDPETQALFQQLRADAREKAQASNERRQTAVRQSPRPGDERNGTERLPAVSRLPTETVTFLLTDIEGSTRLWLENPDAMREMLARHDALAAAVIQQHDGRLIKQRGEGDSLFAVFPRATGAAAAALAFQRALHDLGFWVSDFGLDPSKTSDRPGPLTLSNNARPKIQNPKMKVRIALHTGEAELREGDYYGLAVNHCGRLRAVGHGGQTLLSQTTAALVRDALPEGVSLRELGVHRLKDLQRPEPIFQLLHPELPDDFSPLRSLEAFAHNLPVQLTSFIGREREIAVVKRLLSTTHLLTLTGAGGCGKTRLALQVAAELVEEYADGAWLVELAALSDPGLVPLSVASTLGVREEPGRPLLQTLLDHLRSRSLLLVLDNCEHLLAACAFLAQTVLRSCPELRVLASSREGLGIAGERTYRVPSLSLPEPGHLPPLDRLTEYEAVRLFMERAAFTEPRFTVTDQNAAAVAQLCQRLDGIPLAIELAAARMKALPVEKLNERLDDMFRLLSGGSRTALPRHQTLQALIDWSYDLLSPSEQALFRRFSVFAGGWTLEAAEVVCVGDGEEEEEVLDLLTRLVEKSLVLYEERASEGRYRLLETVRQYARDRLLEAGEGAAVRSQHLDFFVRLAEQAEPELDGPDQVPWLERLEREHDNLRAALAWSVKAVDSESRSVDSPAASGADPERSLSAATANHQPRSTAVERGLRLAGALGWFWFMRGCLWEGQERLAELLALPGAQARTAARAKALKSAGWLAWNQGSSGAARALFEESLAIYRELGYKEGIADSLVLLGEAARHQGDYGTARALLEESLATYRELGNEAGIAGSIRNLGGAAHAQGDHGAARALLEESLAIFRKLGNKGDAAQSLGQLGWVAHAQGDYGAARALFEEGLALFGELGAKIGIAWLLNDLGIAAHGQEQYGAARAHLEESMAIFREQGHTRGIVAGLEGLAALAVAQGQPESAARLLGAGEGLREAMGVPLHPADCAGHDRSVAAVRAALGEEAFAAAWAEGRAMPLEQAIAAALEKEAGG